MAHGGYSRLADGIILPLERLPDMHALDDATLTALIPALRRFARSLVPHPDTADDLVQSALERALSTRTRLRDADAVQPWLFSILYRQFIDHTRREHRRQRLLSLLALQPPVHAPSPEHINEHHATLAAFARLTHEQRALLVLVSVEGFSYQQAAEALGVPVGTIMSRLSRARERLRGLSEHSPSPQSGPAKHAGCSETVRANGSQASHPYPIAQRERGFSRKLQ